MRTLALIGLGKWGKNYLDTAKKIKSCDIRYICARSRKTLARFPDHYIKTTNYTDLLKYSDIDGVIIATPASTHYKIAALFLKSGTNVLLEKPATTNLRDSLKLKEVAIKSNSVFMTGHLYLYHPSFNQAIKQLSEIGEIVYIEAIDCNLGPFRKDISAVWDWAPHSLAMCLEITGQMPHSVTAWGVKLKKDFFDLAHIKLEFANFAAFLKVGSLSPVKKRTLTIFGTNGSLIFDDTMRRKLCRIRFRKALTGRRREGAVIETTSYPDYAQNSPLQEQIMEFVRSLDSGIRPKTDIEHAVKVMRVLNAIQHSLDSKGKQTPVSY